MLERERGSRGRAIAATIALAASAGYGILGLVARVVVRMQLLTGDALVVWVRPSLHGWRWGGVALCVLLPALAWWLTARVSRDRGWCAGLVRVLRPAALLPLAVVFFMVCDTVPAGITALAFPVVAGVIALLLLNLFEALSGLRWSRPREWTGLIFVVSVACYAWLGNHLATETGEHVGDEGHYLAQAESLFEDGDLDLHDELKEDKTETMTDRQLRRHTHISWASRGDHWYSYHPYGVSLVMAPFWGWGVLCRYIVLAVVAALGNVGVYRLSRDLNVGRGAALFVVLTMGASYPWAFYSARALPEMLGASLLVWLLWSVWNQSRRPWLTVVVGAVASGGMVVSHERFIPMSLLGFGFYGLAGLAGNERWPRKILRLGVFTLLCLCFYGLYVGSQFFLFEGGTKQRVGGALIAYPLGMLGVMADGRGLMIVLPAFVWLMASLGLWIARERDQRWFGLSVAAILTACLVLCCSNRVFQGGSCVPGRYLWAVVPSLVPAAALLFQRSNRFGRWWYTFLAVLSAQFVVVTLHALPLIGRGFILPVQNIKQVCPMLTGLFHAYANFLSPGAECVASAVFLVVGIAATVAIVLLPRRYRYGAVVCLLAILLAGGYAHSIQRANRADRAGLRTKNAVKYIARYDTDALTVRVESNTASLDELLKVRFADTQLKGKWLSLTTWDQGVLQKGVRYSQPRIGVNDWDGRGYRWLTLTRPFKPIGGNQVIHISGTLDGEATMYLAVREGGNTLLERELARGRSDIDETVSFSCRGGRGDLYVLVRLAPGDGEFQLSDLYWKPVWTVE